MMNPLPKKCVGILTNKDFIYIETCSGYNSYASDPDGYQFYLKSDAADDEIGAAILQALSKSRVIDISEIGTFFALDRIQKTYKEWVETTQKMYGYKTKRAMFKNMNYVSIEVLNNIASFCPWHHEKLEAWGGTRNGEADIVKIPYPSRASDIGAAFRLALSRCTPKPLDI